MISENSAISAAAFSGSNANISYMNAKLIDILEPKPKITKPPEEIINHLREEIKK